jgi:hypothetical protein
MMLLVLKCDYNGKIKSVSFVTQINSIYYLERHVSTFLRSYSGLQLVFKNTEKYINIWADTELIFLYY